MEMQCAIEDGGGIIEDLDVLKKRKFEDKEGLSSSEGSYCSSSGTEEGEKLKKKSKFDLDKVVEDEEEEEEEEEEDEESEEEEEAEAFSKFTREEVEKMEVKPEEYAVELSEDEKRYYESDSYRYGYYIKEKVDEGCMDLHFITNKELRIYSKEVEKSEGFDIPLLPGAVAFGKQMPNNLKRKKFAVFVARMSKFALKYYNNKYGTNYCLKRLVKSNSQATNMLTYHVTFEATSAVDSDLDVTFQAKVHREFTGDIQVLMCRIKE